MSLLDKLEKFEKKEKKRIVAQEEKKDIEIEEPEVIEAPKPKARKNEKKTLPTKKFDLKIVDLLIDEFDQLKRYFRDWNEKQPELSYVKRPAMKRAIENFEKHLEGLK